MKPAKWLFVNILVAGLGGLAVAPSQAASVYLTPAIDLEAPSYTGQVPFTLSMDFDASDPTLGGGIDVKLDNVLSFVSFAPSSYFSTVADPSFSGFGTTFADNAYEIHFGSFSGLSGVHDLGTITVNLNEPLSALPGQMAAIDLSINQHFGSFYSAVTFNVQSVALSGAAISAIAAVPEPDIAWMMLGGLGVVGVIRRRLGPSGGRAQA